MSALSIPPIIMASITFYVGLYHLLIYCQHGQQREHLTFALMCLAVGFYDVFSAGLYNVTGVVEGMCWERAQLAALALFSIAFLWFVADYTSQVSSKVRRALSVYFLLCAVVQVVDRSGLTWLADQPAIKEMQLPFGLEIVYYEASPGPFTVMQNALGLLGFVYIFWAVVKFYRSGRQKESKPLLVAMGFFFISVFNDVAVGAGVYDFVYTLEYAYMGMVLLMAYFLSIEMVEAAVVRRALRASERQYRTLFELSPEYIMLVGVDSVVLDCNTAAMAACALPKEEMVGKSFAELMALSEEDRTKYTHFFSRVVSGEKVEPLELQVVHGDQAGYVEIFAAVLETDDIVDTVQLTVRDITRRKQVEAEHERLRQEVIEAQQQTIQELASPVIPVVDTPQGGVIVMPLIGSIDSLRAGDITCALLAGIREHRARVVILDITGVPVVDSGVANHLNKTIQTARLKGVHAIVTGISDAVAEAIVDLGIDWSDVATLRNLQRGLRTALAMMGLRIADESAEVSRNDGEVE
jgi:PAS domain S-box-containing protein